MENKLEQKISISRQIMSSICRYAESIELNTYIYNITMKFISYYEKSEGSSFVKKEVLHSLLRLLFEYKRE